MEKLDGKTIDVVQDNIGKLKQLFPEVFTEEKIDFEKLQLTLGEHIETEKERYEFTWNGKTEAIQMAQKQSTGTLRPCKEESVDWDTTQNLYIEGDNLEVLRLLQNSYRNKVKMIYIDPPYNTGKDFVYKDNFHDNVKNYKETMDESYKSNAETNGRYHTDWLNMMYPRLKLAKSLLKDDGVIFISIDDNEQTNLKKICDEVFGEMNFVANLVWQKKYGPANDSNSISDTHEYILCYAKCFPDWTPGLIPRNEKQTSAFSNPDNDPRGPWRASDLSARTYSKSGDYPIKGPKGDVFYPPASRAWVVNELRLLELLTDNRITFGKSDTGRPMEKRFLSEVKQGITPETWLPRDKADDNKVAKYELKEIIEENVFDTPKPIKLIKLLATIGNVKKDDIVLDFFSGSATLAHALISLNVEDQGNRKSILVQLPEIVNDNSTAYKAGYKNICEIGKERIRRAGQKIKEDNKAKEGIENIDVGFKVFKLDETNLKIWDEEAENIEDHLLFFEGAVKEGSSQEDVLYEILLKYGLDLTVPIEEEKVGNVTAFSVGMGYLVVCLEQNLSTKDIEQLVSNYPDCERMVFLDNGFESDEVKINAEQILKRNGVQDIRVI
ncbi:site-specific DNA-methyltransferase [Sporosarcina sp. YIM B06819]|uniref:site-specific DNA-methyltransferase n=1 Tax=Sporosarcina sp. YIM B06819 TaxID=3081769 RepID=UPI00298C749E|nr:site-specific DNA-methyltransferase [Sporosarcina sp. YIM B06819]